MNRSVLDASVASPTSPVTSQSNPARLAAAAVISLAPAPTACAHYVEHLWKQDVYALAKRPSDEDEQRVWYVRPSEIARQQKRSRTPTLLHSSEGAAAAAAAAINSPAQPAVHGGWPPRGRHFSKSVGNASAILALGGDRDAHRGSLLALPTGHPAASATGASPPRTADANNALAGGDAAPSEPLRMSNLGPAQRNPGTAAPAPVGRVRASTVSVTSSSSSAAAAAPAPPSKSTLLTLDIDQYDGSVSSKIVDKARSPPPILHHKSGERNRTVHGRTASTEQQSPLSEGSEHDHDDDNGDYEEESHSERSSPSEQPDAAKDATDGRADHGDGADGGVSCDDNVSDSADGEDGAESDADTDTDPNPPTESGMSTEEIRALLSRMSVSGGPLPPGVAAAATPTSAPATASPVRAALPPKLRGILVNRRRSSASRAAASSAASSSSSSSTTPSASSSRSARRPSYRKQVSFNSCVRVREHGRVQGGSTSVTRSGKYSLGLDWHIERECMAPLELSIDTIEERRRTAESRAAGEEADDTHASHSGTLDAVAEDEQLLTEPDDAAMDPDAEPALALSSLPSPAVHLPTPDDDVTVESYLNQPLRVHKRYPTNNKTEEMQRIGESARLALLKRYVSSSPQPSPLTTHSVDADTDDDDSVSSAASSSVLADESLWDEGAELEEIRESRSGNFCSCHPPKGRLRAMMMDLSEEAVGALPVSEDNTCCNDDSCACFRAGVGCHVESDHYCLCAGSFVEMAQKQRANDCDEGDETEEQEEEEQEEEEEEDEDNPRPLPLVQAGCLNPAGRYQFDERAGREHAHQYLYGPDPYEKLVGPDGTPIALGVLPLRSPPVRFARARTPSALSAFFPSTPTGASTAAAAATATGQEASHDSVAAPNLTPSSKSGRLAFKPQLTTLTEK